MMAVNYPSYPVLLMFSVKSLRATLEQHWRCECPVMFYSHRESHPTFILGQSHSTHIRWLIVGILGGSVSPPLSPPPGDSPAPSLAQYKSQFAKQLYTDGAHLTRADLDKLRKENVNLKQKVELCRSNKSKFEFLQNELQVLRERVGKVI